MKFNKCYRKDLAKWIIGIIAISILIYVVLSNVGVVSNAISWLFDLLLPLILGIIFALLLNIPMCFFENKFWPKAKRKFFIKIRRPVALILSVLLILGVIVGVVWLVIPQLIEAGKIVVETARITLNDFSEINSGKYISKSFISILQNFDYSEFFKSIEGLIQDIGIDVMNGAIGTVGSFLGGIIDFFVAFVFSVYILLSKEKLKRQSCRVICAWIPKKISDWLIHAIGIASNIFRNFVAGQTIEALILGLLCMVGMIIFRIPYAPTIGVLVGVTALIPVFGAFIGGLLGAFMIVTESPIKALVFIIFLILLQQIEGNFIYPKMMGSRINLPAIWVLFAVTVGGALGGPVGMLFAVPFMSTLYVLIREETEKREALNMSLENPIEKEKENEV